MLLELYTLVPGDGLLALHCIAEANAWELLTQASLSLECSTSWYNLSALHDELGTDAAEADIMPDQGISAPTEGLLVSPWRWLMEGKTCQHLSVYY